MDGPARRRALLRPSSARIVRAISAALAVAIISSQAQARSFGRPAARLPGATRPAPAANRCDPRKAPCDAWFADACVLIANQTRADSTMPHLRRFHAVIDNGFERGADCEYPSDSSLLRAGRPAMLAFLEANAAWPADAFSLAAFPSREFPAAAQWSWLERYLAEYERIASELLDAGFAPPPPPGVATGELFPFAWAAGQQWRGGFYRTDARGRRIARSPGELDPVLDAELEDLLRRIVERSDELVARFGDAYAIRIELVPAIFGWAWGDAAFQGFFGPASAGAPGADGTPLDAPTPETVARDTANLERWLFALTGQNPELLRNLDVVVQLSNGYGYSEDVMPLLVRGSVRRPGVVPLLERYGFSGSVQIETASWFAQAAGDKTWSIFRAPPFAPCNAVAAVRSAGGTASLWEYRRLVDVEAWPRLWDQFARPWHGDRAPDAWQALAGCGGG